jgi:hypothetical protein
VFIKQLKSLLCRSCFCPLAKKISVAFTGGLFSLIRLLTRILFVWFLKEKGLINKDLFELEELKKLIIYEKNSSFYKAILQNLFFATLNRQITAEADGFVFIVLLFFFITGLTI